MNLTETLEGGRLEPGIMRRTRCCSGHFMRLWKPTRFRCVRARFSCRSWTTACGRRPSGAVSPTGFIGPKRSVSSSPPRELLDRQTAFEEELALELVQRQYLGFGDGAVER